MKSKFQSSKICLFLIGLMLFVFTSCSSGKVNHRRAPQCPKHSSIDVEKLNQHLELEQFQCAKQPTLIS
ncbi:MAG: hypothetical protein ACPG4W_02085 [Flavobacteriales bacterium]